MSYVIMAGLLLLLGWGYLTLPFYRLPLAVMIGLGYFLWGIITHKQDRHWAVVLEYFILALLGMSLLIFLSLRA
jgi:hypothetical protein